MIGASGISGTLKAVTGYTGFSSNVSEQSGHYLALRIDTDNASGATITAELIGGDHGAVTLDNDRAIVFRIKNTNQKVKIVATKDGYNSVSKTYDLTDLTLA